MFDSAMESAEHYRRLHETGTYPDYEALLESSYSNLLHPGDTVIDIGAHGGRHSEPFAELVGSSGQIIAFEPLPHKARDLRTKFNQYRNVEVRQIALGKERGSFEYLHVKNAPEESGLRRRVYNIPDPQIERIIVEVSTFDDECNRLKELKFIKIDVEGGEIDCLRGAQNAIKRLRPTISVEYGFPAYSGYGNDAMTLFELASSVGYVLGDLFGNAITEASDWVRICDYAYWDYFMVPIEKVELWSSHLKRP